MRLIDCLRTMPAGSRLQAIESYWAVRQTAARYQILVEQIEWLEALGPALSAQDPPSPTAILDVRTARLAVEAQQADTEAEWTVARLELAALAGLVPIRPFHSPFQFPSSAFCRCIFRGPVAPGPNSGWKRRFHSVSRRLSSRHPRWCCPMYRGPRRRPISLPLGLRLSGCWRASRSKLSRLLLSSGLWVNIIELYPNTPSPRFPPASRPRSWSRP